MKQSRVIPAKIFDDFLAGIQINGEMLDELARTTGQISRFPGFGFPPYSKSRSN